MKRSLLLLLGLLFVDPGTPRAEEQYRGKGLGEWIEMLNGAAEGQMAAVDAFLAISPEEATALLPAVSAYLKDPDPDVRSAAAFMLGNFRKDAIPYLLQALQDKEGLVRAKAAYSFIKIGPDAKEAVPALIAALRDSSRDVHNNAVVALGSIGPEARAAVADLIDVLKTDKNPYTRASAAEALGNIGPAAKEAIPALQDALKDEYTQEAATKALKKIEKGAP